MPDAPPTPPPSAVLDVAALAGAFGRALHRAELPATAERSIRFATALSLLAPLDRDRVYWAAHASYVSARDQRPRFDAVFAHVFDGLGDVAGASRGEPEAPRGLPPQRPSRQRPDTGEPGGGGAPRTTVSSAGSVTDADEDGEPAAAYASADERLARRDFESLDAQELAAVRRLMRDLAFAPPTRRRRRTRRHPRRGHPDPRATLRRARRSGGDPVRIVRRERRRQPRRLVLLCDISGSMEPYARAYLQLLSSAVAGAHAEAFTFATRLTRVTRALRERDPDAALARAAAAAPDWSGGTRIGEALRTFNARHGRRGLARGAVVVILSDGWERDDPALVGREMERLARLAHRIVWVNPRAAAPGFAPLAGGMAAALPHCDALVSGHSLAALDAVVEAINPDRSGG
jgi:uncharacterized protein